MHGFNGATAVMPWNRIGTMPEEANGTSFNGATAVMPWNLNKSMVPWNA